MHKGPARRPGAGEIASALVTLFGEPFGGKRAGRYRISRKFLRQICRRHRLAPELVSEVAEELFERGFVLVDLETHFVVIEQRIFENYRRVTQAACARVAPCGSASAPERVARVLERGSS